MSDSTLPTPDRAGLYVLGLLRGEERRAFEADMAVDPILVSEVMAWEERFVQLALAVPPVQPRDNVWTAIQSTIAPQNERKERPAPERVGWRTWFWDNLAVWRAIGVVGIAAAVVFAVLPPRPSPTASMIAVLSTKNGPVFTVALRADGGLNISAVGEVSPPPGKVWQLWAVASGEKPLSLGIMSQGNMVTPANDMPKHMRKSHTLIVATVEPPGGSPTGRPDTPFVFSGQLLPVGVVNS